MADSQLTDVISHWHHVFEDLQFSSQDLYEQIDSAIKTRNLPDVRTMRITMQEGGVFSAKRVYLRVFRKDHIFDICGAPFGNGFFVSWWLSSRPDGCLLLLSVIPVLNLLAGLLVRPVTYYKIDTALMFQQAIHSAITEVLDQITSAKGVRGLTESERKPIMRDF
jgi:hypothetical protein